MYFFEAFGTGWVKLMPICFSLKSLCTSKVFSALKIVVFLAALLIYHRFHTTCQKWHTIGQMSAVKIIRTDIIIYSADIK